MKLFQSIFGGAESHGRHPESLITAAIERTVDGRHAAVVACAKWIAAWHMNGAIRRRAQGYRFSQRDLDRHRYGTWLPERSPQPHSCSRA